MCVTVPERVRQRRKGRIHLSHGAGMSHVISRLASRMIVIQCTSPSWAITMVADVILANPANPILVPHRYTGQTSQD